MMGTAGQASTELDRQDASLVLAELDLDAGLSSLRWELHRALASGAKNLVVNCAHVPSLPPAALRSLLTAHRVCRARGGRVELDHCGPVVLETVHGSGLARVLHMREIDTRRTEGSAKRGASLGLRPIESAQAERKPRLRSSRRRRTRRRTSS